MADSRCKGREDDPGTLRAGGGFRGEIKEGRSGRRQISRDDGRSEKTKAVSC